MTLHRGKIARNPEVLEVRPLTRDDLAILNEARGPSPDRAGSGAIAKLRDTHHRLARLIASGIRRDEVVARSGYSYQRIASLEANSAFKELVAKYREKVDAAFIAEQEAFVELASQNMITAERMLADKLEQHEEEGTLPSIRELMSIRSDSADRLGYGKKNMTINANVDFAAKMEAAVLRSRSVRQIEAPVSVPATAPHTEEGQGVPATVDLPPSQFRRRA